MTFAEAQEFSLVTCDVRMPGGSGLDLVRDLRERYPDIAVLMITGMDDPATAAVAADLGAYGYVVKPFEVNEILIAAANAIRRRDLEIENRAHRKHLEQLVADRTADLTLTIERLSRAEQALQESQEEAIQRLAFAAEFRDPTTGAHIDRMSRTCELLALNAGLSPDRAELIRIASPMHDIGKIGVPDDVLRKAGKLTTGRDGRDAQAPDHRQRDPGRIGFGASHARRSDRARRTTSAGTGAATRTGLRATQIPFEGRIVAIADVFDALTSERSYKPAFEVEHAVEIMTEERGSHFDPELLDIFLTMVDEVVGLAPGSPR